MWGGQTSYSSDKMPGLI
jgi:hypothetical protein